MNYYLADNTMLEASEFDGDAILTVGLFDRGEAWDCDPDARVAVDSYDEGLDETDGEGDWQVLALDRFGDRSVSGELLSPRWHH